MIIKEKIGSTSDDIISNNDNDLVQLGIELGYRVNVFFEGNFMKIVFSKKI